MPVQQSASTENNFKKGLLTEFTGLNFPEDAATDTDNCVYNLIGEVTRREGFDFETNFQHTGASLGAAALSNYRWKNVGGDGLTQIVVQQIGSIITFYLSSTATTTQPLSSQRLGGGNFDVHLTSFLAQGSVGDPSTIECQYTDGNGFLFIFHPYCDPIYCTYNGGISANRIGVQIRDLVGVQDGLPTTYRPSSLSNEHLYNLYNQGWSNAQAWSTTSTTSNAITIGSVTFTITAVSPTPTSGDPVVASVNNILGGGPQLMQGSVVSFTGTTSGGTLNLTVTSTTGSGTYSSWSIYKPSTGLIDTWKGTVGNYPSDADIWWLYKDTTGKFNPGVTFGSVSQPQAQSPQGAFILPAFTQQRSAVSGVSSITDVKTNIRPKTGCWFEGRVWYAGIDAQFVAAGDMPYSTWSENIYFSQIVNDVTNFGQCYQANDPTAENLFDLLPTDGGVIQIQGCGSIYKLFPVVNGLLVFASNGIWFITGSQGIGFRANDYTITKLSGIRSISGTSFVNVNGWPMFWGEEGIFYVAPSQGSKLEVQNICVGTILSYYNSIPLKSKQYVRGDYNPIDFVVQWIFRSTNESSITNRYQFDSALNLNVHNNSFYPYGFSGNQPFIAGVIYVESPGGSSAPSPVFKYPTYWVQNNATQFTFSEEKDNTHWLDFFTYDSVGQDYTSYFVTGSKLRPIRHPYLGLYGQAPQLWAPTYLWMWTRGNSSYTLQSLQNFAVTGDSGKWSSPEQVSVTRPSAANLFSTRFRRHKIRGSGRSFQYRITSVSRQPFTIIGWSQTEQQYIGV